MTRTHAVPSEEGNVSLGMSEGTSPIEAIRAFSLEMAAKSLLTPRAMNRLGTLSMRPAESLESFYGIHPELVDGEGVFAVSRPVELDDFAWGVDMDDVLARKLTERHV